MVMLCFFVYPFIEPCGMAVPAGIWRQAAALVRSIHSCLAWAVFFFFMDVLAWGNSWALKKFLMYFFSYCYKVRQLLQAFPEVCAKLEQEVKPGQSEGRKYVPAYRSKINVHWHSWVRAASHSAAVKTTRSDLMLGMGCGMNPCLLLRKDWLFTLILKLESS